MLSHHFQLLCATLARPGRCRLSTVPLTHLACWNWRFLSELLGTLACQNTQEKLVCEEFSEVATENVDRAGIWVTLPENLNIWTPRAHKARKSYEAEWPGINLWDCGTGWLQMVLHRYAELSEVCRAAGRQSSPKHRCQVCFCYPSLLSLVFLFCCWQHTQSDLTLKCAFPPQFYGLSWGCSWCAFCFVDRKMMPCAAWMPGRILFLCSSAALHSMISGHAVSLCHSEMVEIASPSVFRLLKLIKTWLCYEQNITVTSRERTVFFLAPWLTGPGCLFWTQEILPELLAMQHKNSCPIWIKKRTVFCKGRGKETWW